MTRKKGIALIICLTLIISMALPGTLAFSGDPSAANENLTLAEDTPVPTPENSVEEKGCTCDPKPAEGEPHGEGCPFYTSVMGTAAAAEGTDSPVTEPAAGHIRIKINVFCVDDSNEAIPQPGVTVEVRRDLYSPYYGENDPLPEWSNGLVMFTGTSDASGVVNIDAPYTVVKDPDDNAYDTAYLGDGRDEPENPVFAQSGSDEARKKLPTGKRISAALDSFFTSGRRCGLALLLGSVAWFLFTSWFLDRYGYGIMSYRYDNFMTDGGSLFGVIINVLKNPVLVFSEAFEAEKLTFLAQALLPLALLPLITRLPHRLLLLCPLLLIGLMSDYQYQHSIYFQYVFGWSAFLFYAAVLNLSDLGRRARRALCAVMLSASVLFSAAYAAPLGSSIFPSKTQREKCAAISEAIADIPGDASVTSDTFILPHLADREIIYELDSKATSADTDYVVFDLRYADAAAADERETAFTADGYETVCRTDGVIMIMKR